MRNYERPQFNTASLLVKQEKDYFNISADETESDPVSLELAETSIEKVAEPDENIFQPGEKFDPSAALSTLISQRNKINKLEFKKQLGAIKYKTEYQKIGLVNIENSLYEIIKLMPDINISECMRTVIKLAEPYALTDKQLIVFKEVFEEYVIKHQAIQNIVKDFTEMKGQEINGPALFEKIFKIKPTGRVIVSIGAMVIHFALSPKDYALFDSGKYSSGGGSATQDDIAKSKKSRGFFFDSFKAIPNLEGVITMEQLKSNQRGTNLNTFQHEAKHAYNELVEKKLVEHFPYLREHFVERYLKDEIVTYYHTQVRVEDIRQIFLKPDTIYDYGYLYGKENSERSGSKQNFSPQYITLVDRSLESIKLLESNNFSRRDIEKLLFREKLGDWPKIVARLLEAVQHQNSHIRPDGRTHIADIYRLGKLSK